MAVTSNDVARLAGVSQPTVSRALRGDRRITPATVVRIRQAAAQLGYVPSNAARSLATRSTRRIGIVADELTNPFYPELIAPLHDALAQGGFGTILVTDRDDAQADHSALFDGSVDGVILTASSLDSDLPTRLAFRGIPVVLANRSIGAVGGPPIIDEVVPDNSSGARAVAELLLGCGHRRVGCISGPDSTTTARERELAYRDALAQQGIALTPSLTVSGPFSHATGYSGFADLMQAAEPPTAIFCANDVIAIGALNSAHSMGISVPSQVSLVGFDNIPVAAWEVIGLSTVNVDLASMAAQATDLLLSRISDRARPPVRTTIATQLILRSTHGRVSSRRVPW